MIKGVRCDRSLVLIAAPYFSSKVPTSTFPSITAVWKGVRPALSLALMSPSSDLRSIRGMSLFPNGQHGGVGFIPDYIGESSYNGCIFPGTSQLLPASLLI